jgi:hypothetical protein
MIPDPSMFPRSIAFIGGLDPEAPTWGQGRPRHFGRGED